MVGATAPGSLKDAGQFIRLGRVATLVGGDGLCGGFVGKGRDGEEKEEESSGNSFHDDLLRWEGSRGWGKMEVRRGFC